MKCVFHNDRDAELVCPSCGRPVCRECTAVIGGRTVCRACAYNMQNVPAQKMRPGDDISGFLFFIFLVIPGLRHMYLGFMKRGFQFLTAFFGTITVAAFLGGNLGTVLIPVIFIIWFYSAFDSYQIRKLMLKGEKPEDKPIFDDFGFDDVKNFIVKRKKLTGVIIVILGIYMLLSELARYSHRWEIPDIIGDSINLGLRILVPALLIAGGIYLMTRGGSKRAAKEEQAIDKIQ
jgi:uncharacterized membrane protein (DUF485 family)